MISCRSKTRAFCQTPHIPWDAIGFIQHHSITTIVFYNIFVAIFTKPAPSRQSLAQVAEHSLSRRRTGRAAAVLELLAAAARAVVVAAILGGAWACRRPSGRRSVCRVAIRYPMYPRVVFFNARNHLPTMFRTKSNDGFRFFNRAYADHGGPLVTSQLCQSSSRDLPHGKTQILSCQLIAWIHRDGSLEVSLACMRRPAWQRVQPRSLTNF